MRESSQIGTVRDVDGPTVSVALDSTLPAGLIFVAGEPYRVGQVGSFARVPIGFADLVGVVTRVGAGAAPNDEQEGDSRWLTLEIVGEARRNKPFVRGVSQLPSVGDPVHVITGSDLAKIYGAHGQDSSFVTVGHVAAAESIAARLDLNQLITRHSAVVGSTGSGKSTTVASLVQSIANVDRFASARVLLFDIHGEYARAFSGSSNVFSLNTDSVPQAMPLDVPFWALSFDELVPMLFGSMSDDAGRAFVRDEVARLKLQAITVQSLPGIEKDQVSADTPVPFSLRTLWFDLHVLLNATHSVSSNQTRDTWALQTDESGAVLQSGDSESLVAPLFKSHTLAKDEAKVYLSTSNIPIRRQVEILGSRLRDRRFDFALNPGQWAPDKTGKVSADLDVLLEKWVGGKHAVSIVDLSGIPPSVISNVVGSMTRVIYDAMFWARNLSEGARERPLLFVFEEAHAYLGNQGSNAAQQAVQRVVREGRKYGIGAMIVSQRPSEIDGTILSQCGTLVAMRLSNSVDRAHISSAAADNMKGVLSMLPILRTGEAIIIGESVPIPMRAVITLPSALPDSEDPLIVGSEIPGGWDRAREPANYGDVTKVWRLQNPLAAKFAKSED